MFQAESKPVPARGVRRWWVFLIAIGSLLLLAFYTVTDPQRLAHDHVLGAADLAGYAICHRLTGHSFLFAGRQMPLCARCTGMYLGVSLTFSVLLLAGRARRSDFPSWPLSLILLGFVAAMGVDGLNSYSHFFPNTPHLYEPKNWLRLLTGTGTGLAIGIFAFPALAQTLWRRPHYRPPLGSVRELAGLMLLAAIMILLVLSNHEPLLYVLAIVSAAGVITILTVLNTVLLLVLIRREGQATHWRNALPLLAPGLLLAALQVAIISLARYSLTGTMTGFPGL